MSPDDVKQNLQEPLLQRSASDLKTHIGAKNSSAGRQVSPHKCVGVGLFGGVLNLCKAVLGAGLLSIPRAFSLLGGLVGTAAFLVVSLLTVFTINLGMIQPSVAHGSSSDGGGGGAHGHGGPDVLALTTYSAAVSYWVGRRAERLLSIMMLVGLLGFSATFLDIIADILVGDEINPGLLTGGVAVLCSCNVFPPTVPGGHHVPSPAGPTNTSLPGPSLLASDYEAMAVGMAAGYANHEMGAGPYDDMQGADAGAPMARLAIPQAAQPLLAAGWLQEGFVDVHAPAWATLLCDRRVVLLGVVFGLLLPLAVQRNMGSLSAVNAVGLASLAVLLASLLWLAGSALWQGSAYALPLLPDFEGLGDCGTIQALTAFGIMSVLLTANGCHANMFPLMTIVQPFSARSMQRILGTTIAITTTYYWLLSVTAYLVFGEGIKEDILTNLSPAALAPLVGQWAGMTLAFVLRAGYMVSIMGSAVLTMFPLRQSCIDLLLGSAADPMQRTDSSGHISTCPDGMLVDDDGTGGDQLLATSGPAGESGRSTARHSANGTGIVSSRVTGNGMPAVHQLASAGVETSAGLGELIGAVPGHLPPSPTPEQLTAKDIAIVIKSGNASHHLTSLHHGSPAPAVAADALPAVAAAAAAPADATAAAVAHARWMSVRERRADALHVPLTLGLMSTAYIAAVTVPSIWVVISLVGSVSLTFMCFIMPALIGLHALHKNRHLGQAMRLLVRGVLYLVVLLGGLVFINGWVMLAVNIHKAQAQPGPA